MTEWITVRIPAGLLRLVEATSQWACYGSRAEMVRSALRELDLKHLNYLCSLPENKGKSSAQILQECIKQFRQDHK
jgi:Arc/MetJ-type ribon-helix-helix transcriptional regulator